jgi:hypothetical protein
MTETMLRSRSILRGTHPERKRAREKERERERERERETQ